MEWVTVAGSFLALILLVVKWWLGRNSEKKAKQGELKKEWSDAKKTNDRGSMLSVLRFVRRKKK
jgi:hypothetical protein